MLDFSPGEGLVRLMLVDGIKALGRAPPPLPVDRDADYGHRGTNVPGAARFEHEGPDR